MTEIGFYHLVGTPLERVLPRLLDKVLANDLRAVVLAPSAERVAVLDALLWTYDQGSFLPHGGPRDGDASEQPIYLTSEEENPNGATVLVLTDGIEPAYLSGFQRCLDLFDGKDTAALEAARERWRRWRDAGHTVTYWQQDSRGAWQRKG